jgi:hypothetical protein
MLEKDKNIKSLMDVGFHGDEADMIITRCGNASIFMIIAKW